jgi:TonB family protein
MTTLSQRPIALQFLTFMLIVAEEQRTKGLTLNAFHNAGWSRFAIFMLLVCLPRVRAANAQQGTDLPLSAAVCPIVYPVDESPSARGYHYIFYGNGFFINKEGYLITAAHVLSQLHDSQPYLLLQLPMAPPRLLKADVIAVDNDHDVAILQATPNPFEGKYRVDFLRLATERAGLSEDVFADALRPSRLRNPYSFDALREDRSAGAVLEYRFTQLDKGRLDTEIFLFTHDILLGDSGAPVFSAKSQEVVGLIEGRWLHGGPVAQAAMHSQSAVLGAVVPIHYAIALLVQKGIAWHGVSVSSTQTDPDVVNRSQEFAPVPLSLVAASYPANSFFGATVVLDARITNSGRPEDIQIVRGENPFLDKALSAVQSWTFRPTRSADKTADARIGIIFQFTDPFSSTHQQKKHDRPVVSADVQEQAARPLATPEPDTSSTKQIEGSVILCEKIDATGQVSSIEVVRGEESLTPSAVAAARQWQFVSGRHGGSDTPSEVVVVIVFRRSASTAHTAKTKAAD